MSRIKKLTETDLDEAQRRIYENIKSGPRGRVPAPMMVWLRSPEFASCAQELGAYVRYNTSLGSRLSELAILVTAKNWECAYEWHVHSAEAQKAGLEKSIINDIERGVSPQLPDPKDRAVYVFSGEIHRERKVSPRTFELAKEALGEKGIVELCGILGYYTLMAMTINAFDVGPAELG
jgi:4-carboxymuconolactone decarboxylase